MALDSTAGPGGGSAAQAMMRRVKGGAVRRCSPAVLVAVVAGALALPSLSAAVKIEPAPVAGGPGLPDGRVYELVSPAVKNGNEAGVLSGDESAYGVASADGSRILYADTGPLGESQSGVENYSVSERSETGWTTKAALPPPAAPIRPQDPISSEDPTSLLSSADLTKVAFTARDQFAASSLSFANPNFSFSSAFLAETGGAAATWIGAASVEHPFPAPEEVGSPANLSLVGASPDLGTTYFEYYGTLVPEDAPRLSAVEGGNINDWGLYEWRAGQLKAAGLLPDTAKEHAGEEDPYGAVAAGIAGRVLNATAPDYANEVSRDGSTVFFVSPDPEAESGRPPQLYARVGGSTTVLVSRSNLTGQPSSTGVDGIRDLSQSHLGPYAYASPDGSHVYFTSEAQLTADAPADSTLKEYRFDLTGDTLSYVPGVTPPILASSEDGSALVFDDSRTSEHELALWQDGRITDIAPLPTAGGLYLAPVYFTADASAVVFQTNAPFPGFNDGAGFGQVYRYDIAGEGLSCVSCPPLGQSPIGTADLSNDALHHPSPLLVDSRSVSEDGSEIFFDTPSRLVPQDENEARDVYEWHAGSLSLISSGAGTSESLFLDNSASGSDVFFATRANLIGSDGDGSFDVYDARVGGGFPAPAASSSCAPTCPTVGSPTQAPLASTELLGAGEQVTPGPSSKSILSRAQKLARNLKVCKKERGRRRRVCEVRARRRYGKHQRMPHP